ncbi:nitroreductase [Paraburkholderia rhynchosiae]|uniref:Nitroreductase n=1 Tax=Paraburkholderia rhynchosiae TaxID=487049 RepID=A0A2N7W7W6_9BURK|nr:nitroreductase [Paraburkholderia rhynchosiae]PMS25503.1 nitroreductase [Paraburkholderia rhynchosiae]CAB3733764.1 Nitroreductase NfnB [Paraburkholderia rhynchosiae]
MTRPHNTLNDLISRRHTCRAFLPTPVARSTIESILEAAQRTPSWGNVQPWQVAIVSGDAADAFREAYTRFAQKNEPIAPDFEFPQSYEGVLKDRRRECGWRLYESVGVTKGDREGSARQTLENFRFFGAPHVAIITTHRCLGTYGAVDAGAYLANFILAAQDLGVASAPQAALASYPQFIRSHLGISDDRNVVAGISFGYEDTAHAANNFRTERAPLDEVVTWID